jgi:hypothetical protein
MDQRPIVHHNTYCHHEAGHAVAFWHFGIEIEYVRITPDNPRHTGETKTVPHELSSLAEIEAEMQCAAAGEIAASMLSSLREDPADTELIEGFKRNASRVAADPGLTSADGDGPWFAKVGLERDEICRAMPGADTGPESWLPFFRKAEQLMSELWPAVKAVASELVHRSDDLRNDDVAALAAAAIKNIQQ